MIDFDSASRYDAFEWVLQYDPRTTGSPQYRPSSRGHRHELSRRSLSGTPRFVTCLFGITLTCPERVVTSVLDGKWSRCAFPITAFRVTLSPSAIRSALSPSAHCRLSRSIFHSGQGRLTARSP